MNIHVIILGMVKIYNKFWHSDSVVIEWMNVRIKQNEWINEWKWFSDEWTKESDSVMDEWINERK